MSKGGGLASTRLRLALTNTDGRYVTPFDVVTIEFSSRMGTRPATPNGLSSTSITEISVQI